MDTDSSPGVKDGAGGEDTDDEVIEDPRVLAAVERLADLDGLPIAEQVEVFADVHARLAEALGTENTAATPSTFDAASGQVPPGGTSS